MDGIACPVCGEKAVIEDRSGEASLTVCGECGTVVSEFNLTADHFGCDIGYQHESKITENLASAAPKYSQVRERENEGKVMGKKLIKVVCAKLNYPPDMTEFTCSLYYDVIKHKEICDKTLDNKKLISHACIYIIGRSYNRPITLKEFCGICQLPVFKVASFVKIVIRLMNISLPHQSIGSLTAHVLSKAKLNHLTDCVLQILQICDRLWLSTGRHRDIMITVAAYFAWVVNNIMQNKCVPLKTFCRMYKFAHTNALRERYKEMKDTLSALTENLPWARHKGMKDFVFVNLEDTLKYQRSLIYSSCQSNLSGESDQLSDDSCDGKESHSEVNRKRHCDSPGKENSIFMPPSCKKSKKEKISITELCENKCENLLSDSEELNEIIDLDVDQYIRTEEEVRELVKVEQSNK